MVQTGCDQLMDTLLIGWWEVSGSQHHQLLVPVVLGPMCCGHHMVHFSHLVGVSGSEKQLEDIMCIP